MANKDFCYCNGYRCALKEYCVRYVNGGKAKLDDCNHTWIDDCGEDRIGYIETEK